MTEPLWLELPVILAIHDRLLSEHGGLAGIRDRGLLESAIGKPGNLFTYGKPSVFELTASYSFGIAKNHAFIDGNKRTAFVTAAAFVDSNGYELIASEAEATLAMLALAAGDKSEAEMASWFEIHSQPTPV